MMTVRTRFSSAILALAFACASPQAPPTAPGAPAATEADLGNRSEPNAGTTTPEPGPTPDEVNLGRERALVAESRTALGASDYVTARSKASEAVSSLLSGAPAEPGEEWISLLESGAVAAHQAQDSRTADSAWQCVLDLLTRALPDDHPRLQSIRLCLATTRHELGDLAGARALQEKVLEVRSRTLPDDHPDLQQARSGLAVTLRYLGDLDGSQTLFGKVLEVRSRTLPDDHPDLQAARHNYASAISFLGDLQGARALLEKVLEVRSRTLPDDHPDLQSTRQNLAGTIKALGDLRGARILEEKVLEVRSRTLPEDHPKLQMIRLNLATTMEAQGDLAGARDLEEKVLEIRLRTLPDDHPDLQATRNNLATTLLAQGDAASAIVLLKKVDEIRSRTLPEDHPDVQKSRENLALAMRELGDLPGSRILQERVVEVLSRTLPDDDPDLQSARSNLALVLMDMGDLDRARALQSQDLEVCERTLPDDHPDLQASRGNLAATLRNQGDLAGARTLQEKVLEVRSRTLPDDHPELQAARTNLATTMLAQSDLEGARALDEIVLEIRSRTLEDDHPRLQLARTNLATTLQDQGDFPGARVLQEKVLEIASRTLPEDHPDLQTARLNLASTMHACGEFEGSRLLQEVILEVYSRTLPEDHPNLQMVRRSLAGTIASESARARRDSGSEAAATAAGEEARARCAALIGSMCRAQTRSVRGAVLGSPAREAEERCSSMTEALDAALSFGMGYGVFEPLPELNPDTFVWAESARGAAVVSAQFARRATTSPEYAELRAALGDASATLAALAQKGTTSVAFDRARTERESVERRLLDLARESSTGIRNGVEIEIGALVSRLGDDRAVVSYRRYRQKHLDVVDETDASGNPEVRERVVESLCAFVLRGAESGIATDPTYRELLTRVDLGPIAPIEETVRAWRDSLGVGKEGRGIVAGSRAKPTTSTLAAGTALREQVLDPLLSALGDRRHLVVALDDVLNLVPLDALPLDGDLRVGDRWQVETRATLSELLGRADPLPGSGKLIAFGDVDYGTEEIAGGTAESVSPEGSSLASRADTAAGILRGSPWSKGFSPLPGTGAEVRGIAEAFRDPFGAGASLEIGVGDGATRGRLLVLASQARWLHIATHGWFAPESIPSWNDPEPLDQGSGLGMPRSGQEQVKGMSPLLLCGLALAGANLPESAVGRVPGLVSADELSTLDLSNCELAVLSACDTNVGERRAGQGVASLQRALQMAGARSVITSLWKVPDEATKELMVDFYRRMWVEKKPKWQALWEAKTRLREAKDESGRPIYTTRDWAAWVLTGEPD